MAVLAGVDRARERSRAVDETGPRAAEVEAAASESAGWDLSNLDHRRVDYWIGRFQTDKRGDYRAWLSQMGRYATLISAALAEKDMPQDLMYLAMIESGFKWNRLPRDTRDYDRDMVLRVPDIVEAD